MSQENVEIVRRYFETIDSGPGTNHRTLASDGRG